MIKFVVNQLPYYGELCPRFVKPGNTTNRKNNNSFKS